MKEDFRENHHKDVGYVNKEKPIYRKLKGFSHIWTYFTTSKGSFICSKYRKEKKNGLYITTITNSPEGWRIHLFFGGSKFKSWFKVVNLLEDAEEYCNLFLEGKLSLDNFNTINEKLYTDYVW